LKLARLRRKYSAEMVAQRAGISRKTLSRVERGDSAVALGIYARVMQVLRLEDDLAKLAADDPWAGSYRILLCRLGAELQNVRHRRAAHRD
jgi:transcriptional regulator with XRE-family HTH domain